MAGERDACGHRFHIQLEMVSNNRLRRNLRAGSGLAKNRFRSHPIPFVAQQHIDHLPVLIRRTI